MRLTRMGDAGSTLIPSYTIVVGVQISWPLLSPWLSLSIHVSIPRPRPFPPYFLGLRLINGSQIDQPLLFEMKWLAEVSTFLLSVLFPLSGGIWGAGTTANQVRTWWVVENGCDERRVQLAFVTKKSLKRLYIYNNWSNWTLVSRSMPTCWVTGKKHEVGCIDIKLSVLHPIPGTPSSRNHRGPLRTGYLDLHGQHYTFWWVQHLGWSGSREVRFTFSWWAWKLGSER